jgi:3-dehydroquinate synthase
MDLKVLRTLPQAQIKEGLAEIIKYGVIEDEDLFLYLEENLEKIKNLSLSSLEYIITRCVQIKARVVQEDEREKRGKRQVLNFGHTIGHAIESGTGYGKYSHGEAVAVGMIAAARIAKKMGFLPEDSLVRMKNLVRRADLPSRVEGVNGGKLWDALYLDKKIREKKLYFVLPRKIGQVFLTHKVPLALVREALEELGVENE